MHVRCPDLGGIFKHRLQQPHHGCAFETCIGRELAKINRVPEIFFERPCQTADFLGAPVQAVQRQRELALGHRRNADVALEQARQIVVGRQIQWVGQRHQQAVALVFQHHRPKPPRRRLWQQLDDIGAKRKSLEVDKGNAQLPRQAVGQQLVGDHAALDQQAAGLLAGLALQLQGLLQLLLRNQALLHQHIAQAQFLRSADNRTGSLRGGGWG